MIFGPVSVGQATGAILAHSLHVAGTRLRKGHVLTAADVAELIAEGVCDVTVARLETGDLHEDAAAADLADVLPASGAAIDISAPFTGRVNLVANRPGVVRLDVVRLNAANAIDPMITVATVPDFHQIHPGGMIATVKIISYGVAAAKIQEAGRAASGAIDLATPVFASASLIVTTIAGGPGTKGVGAIENRIKGLGMTLDQTQVVAHDQMALATGIGAATGDIVLILTGSATSDVHDTAPAALRQAGGRVERFGLPVDPGNLLFLGDLAGRPVIGLPGSARSPVLHGADWVLARVACGISVRDADMAAMGVGGLLKEIPTRPQPRQRPNGPGGGHPKGPGGAR